MDQEFRRFLLALQNHQLIKGYHMQAFRKIVLAQNLPPEFIGFMSNQIFLSSKCIFFFIQSSIKHNTKEQEDTRSALYKIIADFTKMRGERLADYVQVMMGKFKQFYAQETNDKLKGQILRVLGKVLKHSMRNKTFEQFVKPKQFSQFLIKQLKICGVTPTLRGAMWYTVSLLYREFPHVFEDNTKRQIQQTMLKQLETMITLDKNLSTIAKLVKSLSETMGDNFLDGSKTNRYFKLLTVLMIPLKSTYDVPKAALKSLKGNAQLFHSNILNHGKQIFETILELMSHNNKELKQTASETLEAVNVEIVKGIFNDMEKYSLLYTQIIEKLWDIIRQKIPNQVLVNQKSQSQAGKMATVLKIIGDLAPVIVRLSGVDQLQLMFEKLIEILDSKTFKTFDVSQLEMNEAMQSKFQKASSFVYLLYNQKLICSYLTTFGKIIPFINSLAYTQIQILQKLWLLGIKQYPNYYQKYIPLLVSSMSLFLVGFSTKKDIFQKWLNKMILMSLKQSLDFNKVMISTNQDYYIVIKRSYDIWSSLMTQSNWKKEPLAIFTDTLFECFEFQLQNLDISYKKTIQDADEENQIINMFVGGSKLFQAVNISQYQYMYSLTLVFEHILLKLKPESFLERVGPFYMQILRKFKRFPKSIPLMKLCRSLNEYILQARYLDKISKSEVIELIYAIQDIASQIYHHLLTFQNIFLNDSLKMLLSLPEQVIFHNEFRMLKVIMPVVLKKALDIGNEIQSLAFQAVKCLQRLFVSKEKKVVRKYLKDVINHLEKYLTFQKIRQNVDQNANLSLWELEVTNVKMVDECLRFLGRLGGDAHLVVPNHQSIEDKSKFKNDVLNLSESTQSDYISWDYDTPLMFSIPFSNYTFDINIPKLLPRLCSLMVDSQSYNLKVTAAQLMHSIIIYIIGKSATNPNQNNLNLESNILSFKKVAGKIYQKVLPFIFKVSCNTEHPSCELMRTLSIHLVRFLSNTQQPDSPDVLVVISLLLQLLACSQDISDFSSKCLVELIKYNIKQNPNKQYPLFKMVMRNMWPLALNKRPGTISLIIQILKIIYRQNDLIGRYVLQFYSLILTLSKSNHTLSSQFRYLLDKMILITKKLIHTLKITAKQNSKFKNIYEVIDYLYTSGITSAFSQQREVSAILFQQIFAKCQLELKIGIVQFLQKKSRSKNMLFGTLFMIVGFQVQQSLDVVSECSRLDAQTQMWGRMSQNANIQRNQIVNYIDFKEIYLASVRKYYEFILSKQFRQQRYFSISAEATSSILLSFLKIMNLFYTLLKRNDEYRVSAVVSRQIEISSFLKIIIEMFLKPQVILQRINHDVFLTEYRNSFKQIRRVLKIFAHDDFFKELKFALEELFFYEGPSPLIQQLVESNMFDMQLELYLKGQAEINSVLLQEQKGLLGKKWIDLEMKKVIDMLVYQTETSARENKSPMSKLKMKNLTIYLLSNPIERVLKFATTQLISNSKLFQMFQKQFIMFISRNWDEVGEQITAGYVDSVHISKTLFGLIKFLNPKQCANVGEWLSTIFKPRLNPNILEQQLKINFFLMQNTQMSARYQQYLHFIIKTGMDPRQSLRIHESTLNLIGLTIQYNHWSQSDAPYFSKMLSDMVSIYLPLSGSTLKQQSHQRYSKFFKIIKTFIVLCGNISFFVPILPIFYPTNKQHSEQMVEQLLDQYVNNYFASISSDQQSKQIRTVLEMFLDQKFDKDIINNKRILMVSILFKRMVNKASKIETVIDIFNQYLARLTPLLKLDEHVISNEDFMIQIQVKRTVFTIFQSLYRVLPPKRANEQVHKHNHHKVLIIQANETLKNEFKHEALLVELDKNQKYSFSCVGLLRNLWTSAYNLLIILFISTQRAKQHFKSYLFDRKQFRSNILWQHLIDVTKTDMGFQVITNFKVMKSTQKICQPLKAKIQKKYMSSSLFVVNEQIIPKSQLEDAVKYEDIEFQDEKQSKNTETNPNQIPLELDNINKHPCMSNLLILVDFLTYFFDDIGVRYLNPSQSNQSSQPSQLSQLYQFTQLSQRNQFSQGSAVKISPSFEQNYYNRDQETPAWMKSIYEQLNNPDTPLSIQIFLLKLILNRPQIFRQQIWLPICMRYLGLTHNGSKFYHYFYRDVAKQAIGYIDNGFKIEGRPVCLAINKMLAMLPHPQNPYLFSDNIFILQKMLEQKKVYIDQKIFKRIFNFEEGKQNYLEWRMAGIIVLKMSLMCRVPILSSYQQLLSVENSPQRFKFILRILEGDLRCIFKYFGQSKQKYCVAAAGLIGQILRSVDEIASLSLANNVREKISIELINAATGKSRSERQRFCLILNQISQTYPLVLQISRLCTYIQDALFSVIAKDKIFILDTFRRYFEQKIKIQSQTIDNLEQFCITIKGSIDRISLDGPDVHKSLVYVLAPIAETFISKSYVLQTFVQILQALNKLFLQSTDQQVLQKYYNIIILLDSTVKFNKRVQSNKQFMTHLKKSIVKGLASPFKDIRNFVSNYLFKNNTRSVLPPQKLLYFLDQFYIPNVEELWLTTTVPLILGMSKGCPFYERVLFEDKLDNLAVYYDWDFRRGRGGNHTSQPYTPAYTLNTQFIKKQAVNAVSNLNTLMNTQNRIQRYEGMIKASQNFESEEAPIFTQPGFGNMFFSASYQQPRFPKIQSSQPDHFNNLQRHKYKRSKQMSKFSASNSLVHDKFSVVSGNRLRFGNPENTRKDKEYYDMKHTQILMELNKKKEKPPLLRKYKIGQLPDIQITGRDLIDPLIELASNDEEFSSQLLGILFQQMCKKQKSSEVFISKFKESILKITKQSTQYNFMFISAIQKILIMFCKQAEEFLLLDMKKVANLSNSFGYSILFIEENLIQMAKSIDEDEKVEIVHRSQKIIANKKQRVQFLDLLDLYHRINENDNFPAILDKTLPLNIKNKLNQALKTKQTGKLNQSCVLLLNLAEEPQLEQRIRNFITQEYLVCQTLLGNWQNLQANLSKQAKQGLMTKNQSKIYSLVKLGLSHQIHQQAPQMSSLKKYNLFYEQAMLYFFSKVTTDTPKYLLKQQYNNFIQSYNKVSMFAIQSKHQLIETLQKVYEFSQFIDNFQRTKISIQNCKQIFAEWAVRNPSATYDSDITTFQILEGRKKLAEKMVARFTLGQHVMIQNQADWLVQQAQIMFKRGSIGSAQVMLKKALGLRSLTAFFSWPVYKIIAKLQLINMKMVDDFSKQKAVLSQYQILPSLIQKEMTKSSRIQSDEQYFQLELLKSQFLISFADRYQVQVKSQNCPQYLKNQYAEGLNKCFNILSGAHKSELMNSSQISNSLFKIKRKICLQLTSFCDKMISFIDGNRKIPYLFQSLKGLSLDFTSLLQLFGTVLIKSLNLIGFGETNKGNLSNSDHKICYLILKFLKVIQLHPSIMKSILDQIVKERKVPIWIFLHFIPQMMSTLSLPISDHFQQLFMIIARQYPQSLIYQFNSQFEDRSHCVTLASKNIYDFLHQKYPVYYDFINALDSVNHPELRLSDALGMCFDKNCVDDAVRQLLAIVDTKDEYKGPYNKKFATDWEKHIHVLIKDIERKKNVGEQLKKFNTILQNYTKINQGYTKLSNFSLFFETYGSSDMERFCLMTQPCKLGQEPIKDLMIKIQSFDQTILTLGSLRKPKRLTMFGNNEKKYSILVKGGEDLRLDQRIQQIFDLMNVLLSKNVESQSRQQFIRRYQVVPFKKSVGLIQWVDSTESMKSFLQKELCKEKNNYELDLFTKNDAYKERVKYLQSLSEQLALDKIHLPLLSKQQQQIVFNQNKIESVLPSNLLRKGIQKLSKNFEAFLYLKNRFVSNYAVSCAVSYILGIGDRHLQNFLIHTKSATIVLIDFGRSFDYVLDLRMPELIPFRLTKCFKQLMEPIGPNGIFKSNIMHAFKAFRSNYSEILDFAEIFITDPVLDWIKISRNKKGKTTFKHTNSIQVLSIKSQEISNEQKQYFCTKIDNVKKKLLGYNPRKLLVDTLKQTIHSKKEYLPSLIKAIQKGNNIQQNGGILSLEDQAQELIDLAGDQNLIGRTYTGWQPWI